MENLLATLDHIPTAVWDGLRIIVVLLLAWLALRMFRRVVMRLQDRDVLSGRGSVVLRGAGRALIALFALMIVLEQVGIPTGTVWAGVSAVAVMVAVGFVAVWSVLSNALCGLLLLLYAPFRVGDDIELVDLGSLNSLKGRVTDMNLLFVEIRESAADGGGYITQVPNNHFFQRGIRRKQRTGKRETSPLADSFTLGKGAPVTPLTTEDPKAEAAGPSSAD